VQHFELILETAVGFLAYRWNQEEKLTDIKWLGLTVKRLKKSEEFLSAPYIPQRVFNLTTQVNALLTNGIPLHTIPWDVLDLTAWTPFQKKVYEVTTQIPHGETRSYGWVAQRIGSPFASRAVGQALRKNPFLIIVPCHRVLSSGGGLGGFMGEMSPNEPELNIKKRLLELEYTYCNPLFSFLNTSTH